MVSRSSQIKVRSEVRTEKLVFKTELASKLASEMMVTHGVVAPLVTPKRPAFSVWPDVTRHL